MVEDGDPRRTTAKVSLLIPPPIALPGEFQGCCLEWIEGSVVFGTVHEKISMFYS